MSNYASASHSIVFNGKDITEGYISANLTMAGDLQELTIDSLGNGTISQLADQSASFTVTYTQTSESLKKIDEWAAGIQLVGDSFALPFQGVITHDDPIGGNSFYGMNAVITNVGDREWASVVGTRTVTFRVTKAIQGNPVSIAANLKSYFR